MRGTHWVCLLSSMSRGFLWARIPAQFMEILDPGARTSVTGYCYLPFSRDSHHLGFWSPQARPKQLIRLSQIPHDFQHFSKRDQRLPQTVFFIFSCTLFLPLTRSVGLALIWSRCCPLLYTVPAMSKGETLIYHLAPTTYYFRLINCMNHESVNQLQ